jgi:hypothetical protein
LTDERRTEFVRTALNTYQPNLKKLIAYPEFYLSNKVFCSLKPSIIKGIFILRHYPGIRLEGLRKTTDNSIRIAGHLFQYMKQVDWL